MRVNIALKAEFRAKNIRYEGPLNPADPMAENRLIPSSRLVSRLNLGPWYPHHAPMQTGEYVPEFAKIPLKQHTGVPSVPVVKPGDAVTKGQMIADIPAGCLGARLHASVAGTVEQVDQDSIRIRNGGNHS
jgi:hypothetical protein